MKKRSPLSLPVMLSALIVVSSSIMLPGQSAARHHHSEKKKSDTNLVSKTFPTVEAKVASMRTDRPPSRSFEVNFVLSNPTPGPRWFLLPLALPLKDGKDISAFEEHRVSTKKETITIGRALGLWTFNLVLVAPQSKVKLQRIPIAYWGDAPNGTLNFEVIVTPDLRIGNKPADKWFKADPTLRTGTEVKGDRLERASTMRAAPGQTTVVMQNDLHVKLALALSK